MARTGVGAGDVREGGIGAWSADGSDETENPAAEVLTRHLDALRCAVEELRELQAAERRRQEAARSRQAHALDGIERVVAELARQLRRGIGGRGGRRAARRAEVPDDGGDRCRGATRA